VITSKQIIYLCEDYLELKKIRNLPVNIYVDPSLGDLKDMAVEAKKQNRTLKEVRFIAIADISRIFAWDAYLAIHQDIAKLYGINLESSNLMHGGVNISGGKVAATDTDVAGAAGRVGGKMKDFVSHNWHFLDKPLGPKFSKFFDDLKKSYL